MKKRAFTLTELLVVVVIIGVLSAVVLPKFTKVLETRKTTEAEAMLMAVRSEQEARCTLDRPYVQESNREKLASLPENTGSNYTYTLTGSGITASSQSKDYSLRVKSYQDGRICCSGTYCASLNKKYPTCDSLPADSTGCGAEGVEPDPCADGGCGPEPTGCTDGEEEIISTSCGNQKVNVCVNGEWTEQTRSVAWTAAEKSSCSCDTHQATTKPCENGEGQQTRTETCNASTGLFTYTDWDDSACHQQGCDGSHTEGESASKIACACGEGSKKWHCGEDTAYTWTEVEDVSCEAKPADETQKCAEGTGSQTRSYTCQNGAWVAGDWQGECLKTCEGEASRRCGCALRGTQTRTCDTATGQWNAWGSCSVAETPSSKYEEETCSFYTSYNYSPLSDTPGAGVNTGFALTGKRSRSFNTTTCEWGTWSKCVANAYVSLGPFTKASNRHYCTSGNQSYCGGGQQGLNSPCDWPQSGGISGPYCPSRFGDGCYIYQCQQLTEP